MQSAKVSSGNRAIERFVVAVIGGLILVAVGGAILTTVLGLQTQAERDKETRRDQATSAAIIDLVRTQKQIQLDVVQVQQFLTDVSATRGQNGLDTGWAEAEENAQAFHKDLARARVLAGQLGGANTGDGGGNTLLYAVAAAVIGGTSLMGGRGRVVDAVLGGAVLAILANGVSDLIQGGNAAAYELIIDGVVLLLAAAVDSMSRRARR